MAALSEASAWASAGDSLGGGVSLRALGAVRSGEEPDGRVPALCSASRAARHHARLPGSPGDGIPHNQARHQQRKPYTITATDQNGARALVMTGACCSSRNAVRNNRKYGRAVGRERRTSRPIVRP